MTEMVGITIKANADLDKAKLDFQSMLQIMEKDGIIGRTPQGKIYLTKKGEKKQFRGFSIKGPTHKANFKVTTKISNTV
jgi:hypothetical protein